MKKGLKMNFHGFMNCHGFQLRDNLTPNKSFNPPILKILIQTNEKSINNELPQIYELPRVSTLQLINKNQACKALINNLLM